MTDTTSRKSCQHPGLDGSLPPTNALEPQQVIQHSPTRPADLWSFASRITNCWRSPKRVVRQGRLRPKIPAGIRPQRIVSQTSAGCHPNQQRTVFPDAMCCSHECCGEREERGLVSRGRPLTGYPVACGPDTGDQGRPYDQLKRRFGRDFNCGRKSSHYRGGAGVAEGGFQFS